MQLTKELVEFAMNLSFEDLPTEVIQVQKQAFVDAISVMVAAASLEPACRPFVRFAGGYSGEGKSRLLGADKTVSAPMAALANGSLSHALDYEDSHDQAFVHSNAVSIPALCAVAEEVGGICGKELLLDMALASEITCRLSIAQEEDLLSHGWYMPPIHGAMGAVFGLAHMLKFSYEQVLDAIAILLNTYSCSGESVNSKKSVVRLVRDGFAAMAAVNAVLMARIGVRARYETPLEGNKGFYAAYAGGKYCPERVTDRLGERWFCSEIAFKPWPCCRATHVTIGLLKEQFKTHHLKRDDIREIHLTVSDILRMVLEERELKYHPQSVMNAKMSLPFAVGLMLTDGEITLKSFRPERLKDPLVISGGELLTYEIDKSLGREEGQRVTMEIRLKDGTSVFSVGEHAKGSREAPMTEEERLAKYRDCMQYSGRERVVRHADQIYSRLMELDQCGDVSQILALL